jgi:hypothetical protein
MAAFGSCFDRPESARFGRSRRWHLVRRNLPTNVKLESPGPVIGASTLDGGGGGRRRRGEGERIGACHERRRRSGLGEASRHPAGCRRTTEPDPFADIPPPLSETGLSRFRRYTDWAISSRAFRQTNLGKRGGSMSEGAAMPDSKSIISVHPTTANRYHYEKTRLARLRERAERCRQCARQARSRGIATEFERLACDCDKEAVRVEAFLRGCRPFTAPSASARSGNPYN